MNASIRSSLALSTLLTGCSIGVPNLIDFDAATTGATPADDNHAVAQQPLSGTFQGTTFSGKVALSKSSFGSRQITIYEGEASCTKVPALSDGRSIFFTPESWTDGTSYALSSTKMATFYASGTNIAASKGRVEVVTIGTDKTAGSIRIRATYNSDTKVEGEVPVYTCAE